MEITQPLTTDTLRQQEQVRRRAYELYEQRGRADGFDVEDWIGAEAEILSPKEMAKAA